MKSQLTKQEIMYQKHLRAIARSASALGHDLHSSKRCHLCTFFDFELIQSRKNLEEKSNAKL